MTSNKKTIKFDFHMHTTKSDGKSKPEEVAKWAKKMGLDVIAITDHNANEHGLDPEKIFKKYGIKLIQGFELSFSKGHILVLGIDAKKSREMLKKWKLIRNKKKIRVKKSKIKDILRWCIDDGGLVIAAHPCIPSGFMSLKKKFLVELYREGLVHGAEIYNDDLGRRIPKKLYNVWHRMALKTVTKYSIPAYSNSDMHRIERLGNTYNIIEIENPDLILDVLKTGKIEITHKKQIEVPKKKAKKVKLRTYIKSR